MYNALRQFLNTWTIHPLQTIAMPQRQMVAGYQPSPRYQHDDFWKRFPADQGIIFSFLNSTHQNSVGLIIIEANLEAKLPTIWTDGKAEVGRVREEKTRSEKIREEKEREERRRSCVKR